MKGILGSMWVVLAEAVVALVVARIIGSRIAALIQQVARSFRW